MILSFRWFSQEELIETNFEPKVLKDKLFEIDDTNFHIIQRD